MAGARVSRLLMLYKNTAVRLSALFLLLFALSAGALVIYITAILEGQLHTRMKDSITSEVAELQDVFARTGIAGLLELLQMRATQPGANLYIIAGPNGEILAGNVASIQPGVIGEEGWTDRPFLYKSYVDRDSDAKHAAVAHVIVFDNGMRILVGRDLGEPENARQLVQQALRLGLGIMGVGALVIWFAVGRNALKRIDRMSGAARNIMAGDLSERLPVSGSGDEFDRLSISLNAMLARMERLDEGLRQVSDNIAHDLKTPLTRLRNKAESALAGRTEQGYFNALEDVIAESDQLIRTFNALLMISRVEAGSAVAEMTDLDLAAVIADVADLYEPMAEDEGIAITKDIAPDCRIRGNRELVGQTIANLLDNAIKYGENPAQPSIVLTATRIDRAVVLSIADHGAGIPEDKYGDVTKRFVRLDESRSKPGTGLGLALAAAVMELHGGRLEFAPTNPEAADHRGLTVKLVFPDVRNG